MRAKRKIRKVIVRWYTTSPYAHQQRYFDKRTPLNVARRLINHGTVWPFQVFVFDEGLYWKVFNRQSSVLVRGDKEGK